MVSCRRHSRGFTFLELSVVLVIISVVIGMSVTSGVNMIESMRVQQTQTKIAVIKKALYTLRSTHNRLPCPASLTLTRTSANFGVEGPNTASCIDAVVGNATASASAATTVEGAVPVRTLGLPDDMVFDGWGNRFRYAVTTAYTASNAFTLAGYGPGEVCTSSVQIKDGTGASNYRTQTALYLLLSHGPNGNGAYTRNGVASNVTSTANTDERQNCHCNGGAAYDGKYVQKDITEDSTNANNTFDDIVNYTMRYQLQTNMDIASASCPALYIADLNNNVIRKVMIGTGKISTIAGTPGVSGSSGDGGLATSALLYSPGAVAVDSSGNIYISDGSNHIIRKVTATGGIISTFAGDRSKAGTYSGDGGLATSAGLFYPRGITTDSSDNVYFADGSNNVIRKVTAATGVITTVAGNGTGGFSGDGGAATSAKLNNPYGVTVDSSGNIYIADRDNNRIRKVTAATGIITTFAGNGTGGFSGDSGLATSAMLSQPNDVSVDSSGNIYISDWVNSRIRKVTVATGIITTVAGNGSIWTPDDNSPVLANSTGFTYTGGVAVDSVGNIYISDQYTFIVHKVTAATGMILKVAGTRSGYGFSGDGGPATSATMGYLYGLAIH